MLQLPLATKAVAACGLVFWQESEEQYLKKIASDSEGCSLGKSSVVQF